MKDAAGNKVSADCFGAICSRTAPEPKGEGNSHMQRIRRRCALNNMHQQHLLPLAYLPSILSSFTAHLIFIKHGNLQPHANKASECGQLGQNSHISNPVVTVRLHHQ